jgi:ribosome-binding protein aMBF1 (putative translation factor)
MNKRAKKGSSTAKQAAKSVSVSLPEPYLGYIERAKQVKGWSTSELVRRALDVFMTDNPIETKQHGSLPTQG